MNYARSTRSTWLISSSLLALALMFSGCSGCGEEASGGGKDTGTTGDDVSGDMDAVGSDVSGQDVAPSDGGDNDASMEDVFDAGGSIGDAANPHNPNNDMIDSDCDGLSDAEEFANIYPDGSHTDPNDSDTDDDGISDGVEAGRTEVVTGSMCMNVAFDSDPMTRTLPTSSDSDGDGILDGAEDQNRNGQIDTNESNPTSTDSDGDQIPDAIEDANHDGVRDMGELNPANRDTDGDEVADGLEDADHDGIFDMGPETNPLASDTDGDTLTDGVEDSNHDGIRQPYETDPRTSDSDCDGISDGAESGMGSSPLVSDTDGDGLTDGLEAGVTTAVPGSNCPGLLIDMDPNTHTLPGVDDSDGDGLVDGLEDPNHNGVVDMGETDPNNEDSDGDGLADGDEVDAGFDPTDPSDPGMDVGGGITMVCSTNNLKVVDFDVLASQWTLSNEQSMTYIPIPVSAVGVGVEVAILDDTVAPVAGFIVRMPVIAGAMTIDGQNTAFNARLISGAAAENLAIVGRTSPRFITSHDGFDTGVSAVLDMTYTMGTRDPAQVRNALLRLTTGLAAGDFMGLTGNAPGPAVTPLVFSYQIMLRTNPDQLIVIGAVIPQTVFDDAADNSSVLVADLVNGTALALADAPRDKDCDPFIAGDAAIADFLWMADISGSTDDDRGRIVSAANVVFNALAMNGVDFRMGVVPHIENSFTQGANSGDMRGVGFTTDPNLFATYLQDTSGTDGCEFGLDAIREGIRHAMPRSTMNDPLKFRDGAQIAVVYISDEHAQEITEGQCGIDPGGAACDTGVRDYYSGTDDTVCELQPNAAQQACIDTVVQPYIQQLTNNSAIAFAQIITPAAVPTPCTGYACPQMGSQATNEPSIGYVEVVNATGGTFYSPCVDNPGTALQAIVDAVTGAASQFQLTGAPISSTIKVGIARVGMGGNGMTDIVPRDKDNGFDYDPAANSIFFRGSSYRPNRDDVVIASYRLWLPPDDPCGGPCDGNQTCNQQLGVCSCDQAVCALCPATRVCDADCNCACTADCNGQCASNEVCNQNTCACECAADCGGCPTGTVCNPSNCACECDSNCAGACEGTMLECNTGACNCQCPNDCGGACAAPLACNESLCACDCPGDCDAACPGNTVCDPAQNCACVCNNSCGGACPDGTTCNQGTCLCECPADCAANGGCVNRQICDPNNSCACVCPVDCGGCPQDQTCDAIECRCRPVV